MAEVGTKVYKQYKFSSLFPSLSRKANDDSPLSEVAVSDNKPELIDEIAEQPPSTEERDAISQRDCSPEPPVGGTKVSSPVKSVNRTWRI